VTKDLDQQRNRRPPLLRLLAAALAGALGAFGVPAAIASPPAHAAAAPPAAPAPDAGPR
jgi:hypothetical protein